MRTRLRKIFDSVKSSYWFMPMIMMCCALLLWSVTSALDHSLTSRNKKAITWLYISDIDSIRNFLLTIAGAIAGIAGVVFTIIMVPLSIAASQLGPRLLRTFLRDTGTQMTLGIFTSAFVFCIAVLLQLSNETKQPLPQISVNVALLFGVASFVVLIYFINHAAVSMQAPVVVAKVSKELHAAINHDLPDEVKDHSTISISEDIYHNESSAHNFVMAAVSGYLQVRDDNALLTLARQHKIVLQLLSEPGDFIVKETPIAKVWPQTGNEKIDKKINAAFITGIQRTLVQDVTFGINELVEVAVRALSAAINDPFTAITCLHWIGSALCQVCPRSFPKAKLYDEHGALRIIRRPVTFTSLADASFNKIREYGRTSNSVMVQLINTIKTIGNCAITDEQRIQLLHHAALTERACLLQFPEPNDRQPIIDCCREIEKLLQH